MSINPVYLSENTNVVIVKELTKIFLLLFFNSHSAPTGLISGFCIFCRAMPGGKYESLSEAKGSHKTCRYPEIYKIQIALLQQVTPNISGAKVQAV